MGLFKEFNSVHPKAWKQKIQVDLKGANYNETLLWHTDEGISVNPFYTKENRTHQEISLPKGKFNICQNIFVDTIKVANALALDALQRGANAIHFSSESIFDYKKLLGGINFDQTILYFSFRFLDANFVTELSQFCNSKKVFFNIDIIDNLAKTGNWFKDRKSDYQQLEKVARTIDNCIQVNTSVYQNSGANIIQQLAYGLAIANEYLNFFGGKIAGKIHFKFAVGSNYFFEIAKLRAFRLLWTSLLNEYNIEKSETHIFAKPTLRNKTLYDYNVNMLRTTSECMSAILGGVNTISNVSYDEFFHKSNEFGERISRNQLLILQEESGFSEVQNIPDGTYYIEAITQQLAEKALEIFRNIEQGGGFLKQLKAGVIQRKIKTSADREQEKFDNGELVLLGTNKIQNINDQMKNDLELYPFVKKRKDKTLIQPIIQKRLAEKAEQHRLKNE